MKKLINDGKVFIPIKLKGDAMKKILSIITLLLFIAIIAFAAFIKFYITPERVKEFVIPAAERSLNRKVSIGDISINIFKGIGLKDFAIKEADDKTDFVKCEDFVLKFKLLPLLSRQVVIDELKVVSPQIRIVKGKDNKYNFEDIGQEKVSEKSTSTETVTTDAEGLPVSLLVSRVMIEGAGFSLTDLTGQTPNIKSTANIDMGIESIDGTKLSTHGSIDIIMNEIRIKEPSEKNIKDISAALDYAVRFDLVSYDIDIDRADLRIQDIPVSVKGSVKNLKTSPELDITLSLPNIDTSKVLELAASFADLKGLKLSGMLAADIKVTGRPDSMDRLKTDNTVSLKNIAFTYDKINAQVSGDLKFKTVSDDLNIQKADLNIQGIPVLFNGSVNKLTTDPDLDMALSLPDVKMAEVLKLAAPFAEIKDLKLSGSISADVKVKGPANKLPSLKANGNITLKKLGVAYADINTVLNGSVKFNEKKMSFDIQNSMGKNIASLKGTVADYFKDQKINLNIYAKQLFVDKLIPATAEKTAAPASAGSDKPADKKTKEADPLDLKLTLNGEIKVDSALYKGLKMTDFHMKYSLINNRFNISTLTANAGKGSFSLSSLIDLSRPGYKYDLTTNLHSLHADEVVNSMFPKAKDTIFGVLSFNLKLNGAGTLPDNIKKNLVADGDFNIKDGKITDAPVSENLSKFLKVSDLKTINLKKADGRVKIRNSNAKLESIFISDEVTMDPKGNIGLNETLDLAFDLKLSQRLTDKAMMNSGIGKFIKNDEGWGVIPLKITGTFSNPSYAVDVEKAGKRILKKETDKLLNDLLKKNNINRSTQPENKKDPLKQLEKELEKQGSDLFKGLF